MSINVDVSERFKLIQQHRCQNAAGEYAKQMPKLCDRNKDGSRAHQIESRDQWIVYGMMFEGDASQNAVIARLIESVRRRCRWVVRWRYHWRVHGTIINFNRLGYWCGWIRIGRIGNVTMAKIFARLGKRCRKYDASHEPGRRNFAQKNQQCCASLPFSPIAQHTTDDIVRR